MTHLRYFIKGLLAALLLLVVLPVHADNNETIEKIKNSYKELLKPQEYKDDPLWNSLIKIAPETEVNDQLIEEVILLYPFNKEQIKTNLDKLSASGQWPDIDYKDNKSQNWSPKNHLKKTFELVRVLYSPLKDEFGEERIEQAIHCALGYWFKTKPRSKNWWFNEIGTPRVLGEILLLFEDKLTPEELSEGIEILKQSKIYMTGQKKVVLSGNVLLRGLLENNYDLIKVAHQSIVDEIAVGKKDGIKSDWSFHEIGPQLQFGNSGMSYITRMGFYKRIFADTEFEFNQEQKNVLGSFIDDGFQWTIWKRYMDVNALGRQLFKNAQIYKGYYLAINAKEFGSSTYPEFANPLIGHKHFYNSDYTVHRTADWMASVKMSSNRVISSGKFNNDNIKGFFMGDGATCFYTRGDEYANIFPLLDWRKIPGVTAHEDTRRVPQKDNNIYKNETDLVGGISYEADGMTAMELNRAGLRGFKSWFFTDNYVLCLGAGINSDSLLCVTTSIDQCNRKGPLVYRSGKRWKQITNQQYLEGKDLRFFHDNTGYIVVRKASCIAKSEHRTGQWHDIMGTYEPKTVEGDVVSLHINHGASPRNEGYAYIVLPSSNPKEVSSFNLNDIEIVKNDSQAQIVRQMSKKDTYWMAVYQPIRLNLRKKSLSIYKPGVYCMIFRNKKFVTVKSYEFD